MLKFISKLLLLLTIPFYIISCTSEEEVETGNLTFFADTTVGFSKQFITITITDSNDDEVITGTLRQYATNPTCGMSSDIDVFTADLPEGRYFVYAVEADSENPPVEGAWFTGLEGYRVDVTAGTCQRFSLGEDPFDERPNPNARLKGLKMLKITQVGNDLL